MTMMDIHTHILPGVDDGSKNMHMSLQMVRLAYESGVDTIVATPHCMPGIYDNYSGHRLEEKWQILREEVHRAGIDVHLRKGMEVLVTANMKKLLEEKKVWTLNDSKYLLVEFSFDEDPAFCRKSLKMISEKGYIPVIAHPCRYYSVQDDPQLVYEWYEAGYGIQVNKDSILGRFGRKEKQTASSLLRHNLVTCVASDAHRSDQRTTRMNELNEYLTDRYGTEYTYMLMEENPRRILGNRRMVGYQPVPYEEREEEKS